MFDCDYKCFTEFFFFLLTLLFVKNHMFVLYYIVSSDPNTNNLHIVKWFKVFLANINNFTV